MKGKGVVPADRPSSNVCPYCREEITYVLYTDHGRKAWRDGKWVEDEYGYGNMEWRCQLCNAKFKYNDLDDMGIL